MNEDFAESVTRIGRVRTYAPIGNETGGVFCYEKNDEYYMAIECTGTYWEVVKISHGLYEAWRKEFGE